MLWKRLQILKRLQFRKYIYEYYIKRNNEREKREFNDIE